ncbi:APC family permease [Halorussus ruber]|uniref:APC family permease n=1 Tax=Halorussus ruber TaxID=1126238 RepID=UPI0010929222|nr:amino acid permease [Halorussus ruber]
MPDLQREIGLPRATAYGVGQILGAGIYAILGEAVALTGESIVVAFLLSAVVASFTGLSYAELSSRLPSAAGDYAYVSEAFDSDLVAEFTAVARLLVGVIAAATVALAFAGYLSSLAAVSIVPTALALVAVLSVVNFVGIDVSTKLNVFMAAAGVVGMLVVIWVGIGSWGAVDPFSTPNDLTGLFRASFLVFFAYVGFEDLVNVAEETENPSVTVPRAIVFALLTTTVLYALVAVSSVGVVDWRTLGGSDSPLALVAQVGLGPSAGVFLAVVALFSTTNTALINLISTSRLVYGVAESDQRVFPTVLSRVHPDRKTPYFAVALVGVGAVPFALLGDIGTVAELANLAMLTLFGLVNAALLNLRRSGAAEAGRTTEAGNPEATGASPEFEVPFNVGWVPVTAVLGLLSSVALVGFYLLRML